MSKTINDYKKDYANAKTQAEKDAAHAGAEAIRNSQGYSGGADGSQNIKLNTSNNSNSGGSTGRSGGSSGGSGGGGNNTDYSLILKNLLGDNPTNFNSDIVSAVQDAYDARNSKIASNLGTLGIYANDDIMKAAQDYLSRAKNQDYLNALEETPEFEDPYSKYMKSTLSALANKEDFNYNFLEDPSYQALATTYGQLGDQAMQDTLADVSGMTGGLASSAAVSAAAQAKNNWNGKLTDTIPTLMNAAYQRYQNGIDSDTNLLSMLSGLQSNAYSQFANERDAATNTAQYLADYGYNATQNQKAYDYQASRDKVLDEQWLKQFTAEEQQRIIDNAINNRQIGVSEGNLALSRARLSYEQEQDAKNEEDTSHYGGMYAEMLASGDPEGWLSKNASLLKADEIAWLKKYMPGSNTGSLFD